MYRHSRENMQVYKRLPASLIFLSKVAFPALATVWAGSGNETAEAWIKGESTGPGHMVLTRTVGP